MSKSQDLTDQSKVVGNRVISCFEKQSQWSEEEIVEEVMSDRTGFEMLSNDQVKQLVKSTLHLLKSYLFINYDKEMEVYSKSTIIGGGK